MRLDKLLADMGYGTRSQIKDIIKKGRVQVNGQVTKTPDSKVAPETDQVAVDGALVGYAVTEYYMLNKPQNVVSARTDNRYETVVDLIGDALRQDLFPVGRLDVDTEGLLLITNDGDLAHNLLSPRKHVDKVYLARLSGRLPGDAKERLLEGIVLEDGTKTLPAKLEYVAPEDRNMDWPDPGLTEVRLTIHEGKFHQVKRMFEAMGCHVENLKRLSMGPLTLDPELKPGEYRALTDAEIRALKEQSYNKM